MHQTYEVTWKQIESQYLLLRILLIRNFYEEIQLKILTSKQVTLRSHFFDLSTILAAKSNPWHSLEFNQYSCYKDK